MANFSTGLQMGMGLARDVRSANMAAAERRERSKYRKSAEARAESAEKRAESGEARAVSAEKRAVNLDKSRIKSLKQGMKRGRKADKRSGRELEIRESAEKRSIDAAAMQRKIDQYKLENLKDPSVTDYRSKKRLLEDFKKDFEAVERRDADELAPLNKAINEARNTYTASATIPNLVATRDKMVAKHKDFKHGLEQAFMAASNRPYEGKWSVRPYYNEFTNTMSYGAMLEGASGPEVEAAMKSISSMGGNVGISAGASAATPAQSVDPNDPLGITRRTNQRVNRDAP